MHNSALFCPIFVYDVWVVSITLPLVVVAARFIAQNRFGDRLIVYSVSAVIVFVYQFPGYQLINWTHIIGGSRRLSSAEVWKEITGCRIALTRECELSMYHLEFWRYFLRFSELEECWDRRLYLLLLRSAKPSPHFIKQGSKPRKLST